MLKLIVSIAFIAIVSSAKLEELGRKSTELVFDQQTLPRVAVLDRLPTYDFNQGSLPVVPFTNSYYGFNAGHLPLNVYPSYGHLYPQESLTSFNTPITFGDRDTTVPVQLGPLEDLVNVVIKLIRDSVERRRQQSKE